MFKNKRTKSSTIDKGLQKKQMIFLLVCAGITILILSIPYLGVVRDIFNIFTTIVHETGHAIANLITGNRDISIQVDMMTTGGVTTSYGVSNIFTVSAGYVGASLLGGLLLILSAYPKIANIVLRVLGGFLVLVGIFFMFGKWLTLFVTLLFAGAFILISLIKNRKISFFLLNFLAIQLIVNAFTDIITLIKISFGAKSVTGLATDADHMAEITFGTNWFWAIFYLLLSVFIFIIAFRINRRIINK